MGAGHGGQRDAESKMPLNSYTWMHPEARLSDEQRALLAHWLDNFTPLSAGYGSIQNKCVPARYRNTFTHYLSYMLRFSILFFCSNILFPLTLSAQNKKPLDHADVQRWRKIEQERISGDGQWVAWVQAPVAEGDPALYLWNARTGKTAVFPRSTDALFSEDCKLLVFRIKPALDTLKAQRRRKVKDENLPKDTLGIYNLAAATLGKKPNLKNFILPEKWSGWLFYQSDCENLTSAKKDTTAKTAPDSLKVAKPAPRKNGKKPKKENKENGYRLIVCNTASGTSDTIAFVENYLPAEKEPYLLLNTTGKGDTRPFHANPQNASDGCVCCSNWRKTGSGPAAGKGKYRQLSLDESGTKAAFLADTDTTKKPAYGPGNCVTGAQRRTPPRHHQCAKQFFDRPGYRCCSMGMTYAKPVFSGDDSGCTSA